MPIRTPIWVADIEYITNPTDCIIQRSTHEVDEHNKDSITGQMSTPPVSEFVVFSDTDEAFWSIRRSTIMALLVKKKGK